MAWPQPFQFANEFGILRQEGVFSTINVNKVVENFDFCACKEQTAHLVLCENITKNCQKGVTTTLIDVETESQFCIPAGSKITQVVVVDRTCGNLQCELSFMLGFLSDCIQDEDRLAVLAQRLADQDHQITGGLLNEFTSITLIEGARLTAPTLAIIKPIFDAEDIDNGECLEDIDLNIVFGDNFVGEPKELMPAITVTSGELCKNDVDFFICWIPPCPGVIVKPVVVCEPCSPQNNCRRRSGCSPCSPRNRISSCGKGRGCH